MIVEIFKQLEKTTSRKGKERILLNNSTNEIFKEILFYTYNPFYNFYLKKVPKPIKFGNKTIEDSWNDFKAILDELRLRKITGNMAIKIVRKFFEKVNLDTFEIYKQILQKKFTKIGINIKTINKIFGNDFIPEFKIQLAYPYDFERANYPDYWYVTPKLDGIRAIYIHNQQKIFTRKGHEIIGFDHLVEQCFNICEKYKLEFLDGELWSQSVEFNTIQSYVMKQKDFDDSIKKRIVFNIFALGSENVKNTKEMINIMEEISNEKFKFINILESQKIENEVNILVSKTIDSLIDGYEGIMLRHPEIHYVWKRSHELVKFKEFQVIEAYEKYKYLLNNDTIDKIKSFMTKTGHKIVDDFIITDVVEGTGNFKGMLGAIVVEGYINGKKIISKVGSGFTVEQRKELWKIREKLIGKEVELSYQEITKDNSLRFPVIRKIKMDR